MCLPERPPARRGRSWLARGMRAAAAGAGGSSAASASPPEGEAGLQRCFPACGRQRWPRTSSWCCHQLQRSARWHCGRGWPVVPGGNRAGGHARVPLYGPVGTGVCGHRGVGDRTCEARVCAGGARRLPGPSMPAPTVLGACSRLWVSPGPPAPLGWLPGPATALRPRPALHRSAPGWGALGPRRSRCRGRNLTLHSAAYRAPQSVEGAGSRTPAGLWQRKVRGPGSAGRDPQGAGAPCSPALWCPRPA